MLNVTGIVTAMPIGGVRFGTENVPCAGTPSVVTFTVFAVPATMFAVVVPTDSWFPWTLPFASSGLSYVDTVKLAVPKFGASTVNVHVVLLLSDVQFDDAGVTLNACELICTACVAGEM
jgi:hypothetical protein